MTARVVRIAGRYRELGRPFAGTLANAAPDLSTFLLHPGMDPTENELRKMAAHRKIRIVLARTICSF